MAAVEHALMISSEAALGKNIVVEEQDLGCPGCKEKKYALDGWYRGKHEGRQRYRRSTCGRWFWGNLGFEYRQVPRPYITLALMAWGILAGGT